MNRILAVLASVILLAGVASAQFGGSVGVSRSGFGNVVFPGTGGPPVRGLGLFPPNSFINQSFPARLGATVSGFPPFGFGHRTHGARGVGFAAVPFAYPVYVGSYSYPVEPQQPNVTIVYQTPPPGYQQPTAPVIINQSFGEPAKPVIREYPQESGVQRYQAPSRSMSEQSSGDQQYYLIALKDHSIYSAVGYWQDGDTLHYILPNNVHNQVSVELVDKELTEQINKDRKPPVRIR